MSSSTTELMSITMKFAKEKIISTKTSQIFSDDKLSPIDVTMVTSYFS